jgi:hypothetical protein
MIVKFSKYHLVCSEPEGQEPICICAYCGTPFDGSKIVYSDNTGFGYCSHVCAKADSSR